MDQVEIILEIFFQKFYGPSGIFFLISEIYGPSGICFFFNSRNLWTKWNLFCFLISEIFGQSRFFFISEIFGPSCDSGRAALAFFDRRFGRTDHFG
jgi:hypothetical protein